MIRCRKQGSILIRNLFFMVLIYVLAISILRFQNSNLKNMDSVLFSNNVFNYLEVIKNELYFNKQYLHLENEVYIRQENIDKKNYKEFKEIFEGNYIGNGNYFHLVWNDSGEIIIRYFSENKDLFKNIFKV